MADIRSGWSRLELMDRYGLTSNEIRKAFSKLVEARAVAETELPPETPIRPETSVGESIRDLLRHELDFDIPLYATDQPEIMGRIRDITLEGVGLAGISAEKGEIKRLVVLGDQFGEVGPFEFEANCRWSKKGEGEADDVSGFQITRISQNDFHELKKIILVISGGG